MFKRYRESRERLVAARDRAKAEGLSYAQSQDAMTAARRGEDPEPAIQSALDRQQAKHEKVAAAQDQLDRRQQIKRSARQHFGNVYLLFDRIVMLPPFSGEPEEMPLTGVEARVERSGGLSGRATLTRSVLASGWQKSVDDRNVNIIVSGPSFEWLVAVAPDKEQPARAFATRVNATGRAATSA